MKSRAVLVYVVLAFVVFNITLAWLALRPSEPATPPLPDPNGYHDFVQAGQMLKADAADFQQASADQLQATVASNAPALAVLRQGLTNECRVVIAFTQAETAGWMNDVATFKSLGRALAAEARLAELEHRKPEALETWLQIVEFGVECSRGGVLIHRLVGIAVGAIGIRGVDSISPHLTPDQRRQAIARLELLLDSREPVAAVIENELDWSRSIGGVRHWIAGVAQYRSLFPARKAAQTHSASLAKNEQKFMASLLELAAGAYELETGEAPASASDLVPAFLEAVPIDPVTGNPMALAP